MKKIISILMLTAMMFTMLVSCAGSNGDSVTTAPTVTQANQTGATVATTAPVVTESAVTTVKSDPFKGVVDLDERIVTILCQDRNDDLQLKYNEFYADEFEGDTVGEAVRIRYLTVQENLNVQLNIIDEGVNRNNIGTLLKDDITTNTGDYDIAALGLTLPTVFSSQYLYDLNALESINLESPWWDKNVNETFRINDKQYVATGDFSCIHLLGSMVIYFNQKIINSNGVPNLYDLVRNKQWTIDKLHEYAVLCAKNDDDTLTEADKVGYVGENTAMTYFYNSMGNLFVKNDRDTLVFVEPDDRADRSVKAYAALLNDKNSSLRDTDYSEWPTAAFAAGNIAFLCDSLHSATKLRAMEDDFGILPMPMLDEDQERYYSPVNYYWASYAVIPYSVEDPEVVGTVVEALAYYGHKITRDAIYTRSFDNMMILRDEESAEMTDLIFNTTTYDVAWLFDFGSCRTIFRGLPTSANPNIKTALSKSKGPIRTAITNTMNSLFQKAPSN